MNLKIYNTLSKEKELFVPLNPNSIKMYVCGPTVYSYAHIGNARPAVVFDVLYRVLKKMQILFVMCACYQVNERIQYYALSG